MIDSVPSDVRDVIEKGLGTYGISLDGEPVLVSQEESTYEVQVPFTGELLIDETLANYGPLLYNKEGEIMWKGVRDGELLITVGMDN